MQDRDREGNDSLMVVLVGLAAATALPLAVGLWAPLVLIVALTLMMAAAACALAVLLALLALKFLLDNSAPGGTFACWRPGIAGGLATGFKSLLGWLPFGLLSVLVFVANNWIVGKIVLVIERALLESQRGLVAAHDRTEQLAGGLPWPWNWCTPDSVESALAAIPDGIGLLERLSIHALTLLRFLLVVEGFFAWVFLIWLTVRSTLYFLARDTLARQSGVPGGRGGDSRDADGIEVGFDMGRRGIAGFGMVGPAQGGAR